MTVIAFYGRRGVEQQLPELRRKSADKKKPCFHKKGESACTESLLHKRDGGCGAQRENV